MKRVQLIAMVAAVVVGLGLIGTAVAMTAGTRGTTTARPPEPSRASRVSFALRPVLKETTAPCAAGTLPQVESPFCFKLGRGLDGIRALTATAEEDGVEWAVRVTLNPADSARFAQLAARLHRLPDPRNRLAVVIDGQVITAPALTEPIPGPRMTIRGSFNREVATDLAADLTEGPAAR
ncbi:hypothetical protein HII36_54830 [Nonomuraea sp. NN258]|uniref:SecDF P1 head subdomain-containing protein n=1 Tax=Nonomuraea antri TaxID=2730852 RepID=UPI001569494D|nr:hypothetical protein [Nonomuraea antri]NRQ40824.1 hypothetical protein [Nonomuraea antri]